MGGNAHPAGQQHMAGICDHRVQRRQLAYEQVRVELRIVLIVFLFTLIPCIFAPDSSLGPHINCVLLSGCPMWVIAHATLSLHMQYQLALQQDVV